nr:ATP-binding protein [Myxococcota bacterium]
GRVWAESEGLGHGASFHVVLPLGTADAGDEEVVTTDDGRAVQLGRAFDAMTADLDHHADDAGASTTSGGDPLRHRTLEMERTVERHEGRELPEPALAGVADREVPEVVVAEDNADMRRLLSHLLGGEFRVRAAKNGREALALVLERAPALVVTDVMMPEMSGTELCSVIKGDDATAGIPVMLVTSKAEREMKIQGLELGADDYVTKPFHPRELLARARALVRLRLLQEELAEESAALDRALAHLKSTEVQLVQAERLAAVGELAAGVAHEVNNPVNFALNSLRALQSAVGEVRRFAGRLAGIDWRDPEHLAEKAAELERLQAEVGLEQVVSDLDELVSIVVEGLDRTSRLVGDLRDFGSPDDRQHTPLDLKGNLESTLLMLGPLLASAGVSVTRDYAPELPPVLGDPGALKQVFLNLLKNAAEILEKGGGRVRVAIHPIQEGSAVAVEVADDGPGIEADDVARIFEPFFTAKPAGQGTGLGLAICRRIVEAHEGRIEVESSPGAGATFRVVLPVHGAEVATSDAA